MDNENTFDFLIELQKKIDNDKAEIAKRDKIINEFKDVSYLLNKVRDEIGKIKKAYDAMPSQKLKNDLIAYMNEEKDYLLLMYEYASLINEFNHSDNFEKENEFLHLALEFQEVSNSLKNLEKISKKLGNKNDIRSKLVKTVSAEGRNKYIHEQYLDKYNELTKKKRELWPIYRRKYEEFMSSHGKQQAVVESLKSKESSDYYNNERLGIASDYIPSHEEYNQMTNQDKINLEKKYYDDMTLDEKISYCKDVIDKILNAKNTGKKEYIKYDGQMYYVPVRMKGSFCEFKRKLKLLTDEKVAKDSLQDSNDKLSVVNSNASDSSSLSVVNNGLAVTNNDLLGEYVGNQALSGDVFDVDYISLSSDGKYLNKNDKSNDDEIVFYEQEPRITTINNNNNNNNNNNKEKFTVVNRKKPKNKKGLIKKLIAASLAIVASITTFAAAHSFFKKGDNSVDFNNSTIEQSIDDVSSHPTDDDEIIDSINKNDVSDSNKDNKSNVDGIDNNNNTDNDSVKLNINKFDVKVHFGDKVSISDDVIYTDVYGAMNKDNGKPAYHDNDMVREVYGIFLSKNNEYRYVVGDQNKLDDLIQQGWKEESVVMKNDGGFEGAEPIDNIVVVEQNEMGGRSR